MKFGDLNVLLRSRNYVVEIRDKEGTTVCTVNCGSKGVEPYLDFNITEWFPDAAPFANVNFTVYLDM